MTLPPSLSAPVDEELIPAELALCTACDRPIDVTQRHVTLSLSVERQDAEGNVYYGGVRVLGRWHALHSTWEPTPEDRRCSR